MEKYLSLLFCSIVLNQFVLAQSICTSSLQAESCVTFDVVEHGIIKPEDYIFQWDFGDGTKGEGARVTHCYDRPGKFIAKMSLTNIENGAYFEDELDVDVVIQSPISVYVMAPDTVYEQEDFLFKMQLEPDQGYQIANVVWSVNGTSYDRQQVAGNLVVGLNKLNVELTMGSGQKLCAEKNLTMLPNDLKYDTRYLKDILHESANGIAWSGNSIVDNDTIMKLQSVFFQLDEMDISDDMEPVLRKNTDIIRSYPGIKVVIGSFTHSDGDYDLNRSLSIKRSEAIRKHLISRGISPNNLEVADPEITRALENTCSDYLGCDYVDKGLNLRTDFKITRL